MKASFGKHGSAACAIAVALGILARPVAAADFGEPDASLPANGPGWTLAFSLYGWLPWLTGESTVRGRTFDVSVSPDDILNNLDWSTLPVWMSYAELRMGRLTLFNDIVYAKLSGSIGFERERQGPVLNAALRGDVDVAYEMATIELGAAYAVWSGGQENHPGYTAIELLAGGRYWHQEIDVSVALSASATLNGPSGILDLTRRGNRIIARSGSVDWVDPFVGARVKYGVAPGQELAVRGDVGGFGAGSDFSWQVWASYNIELARTVTHSVDAHVGYRALSVDYTEGSGNRRYEYDVIQHGPVMGLTVRF